MNKHDVSKYIDLLHRRTFILLHSGIDWKPEYETELQQINQELDLLGPWWIRSTAERFGTIFRTLQADLNNVYISY